MRPATPSLRQVHSSWVKPDGTAASIAFWPFPKDAGLLSVDDGDRVTPELSWRRFAARAQCSSAGVWPFTVPEAAQLGLADLRIGNLVDDRRDHAARATPGRPKINEHGHGRLEDLLVEVGVGNRDDVLTGHR